MTDPNNVNGGPQGAGPDGWQQQSQQPPHPQAQPHQPQSRQPYAPQQGYAPEQYPQQGHAARPYAPGTGQAPGHPANQQHPQHQQHQQHQSYGQPSYGQQHAQPYGQPPMDDAATTLLPPVPPMDDAATTLLPPVVVSGAMPTAPPARRPAPAPAANPAPAPQPVFDPPTMTLKRPTAPAAPGGPTGRRRAGAPQGGVPAQPAPAAAPVPGAPVRTGSPIIDPGLQPALITAGAAALLAGGAALGQPALALVVALLQVLTAAGWFRLNGMWPARQGIALAALAGLTADAAVLLADSDGGTAAVVGTLGGFFLLVLVLQTFRPSDPKERFYALTVLGSATVVTVLCTALLLADWVPAAVGAVALATVLAAAPLPGPKQLGPVLGLLAAVVFGLVVGAPLALGVLAGLGALVGRRVAGYDFPSRFVHMTAGVALPLAVASPLIWIATRLLAG